MTGVVNKDDYYEHSCNENRDNYVRIAGSSSRHHFYASIPVIPIFKLKM